MQFKVYSFVLDQRD